MPLFKLRHLMKHMSTDSDILPINSFPDSFKGNHSSFQSRVLTQLVPPCKSTVMGLKGQRWDEWSDWTFLALDSEPQTACFPAGHAGNEVVGATCCAWRRCLSSDFVFPLIIFRGRKDSSSSAGAWCHLRMFCFVYLLLKGWRLNIRYPQLSAGNKHLAVEEEGGCDLETNPGVGGMTLASSADPDLHSKGAWSDEETWEGKCVWSFQCSV